MSLTLEAALTFGVGQKPKFAILRFPGSNCDQDAFYVIRDVVGCPVEYVWHQDTGLAGFDVILIPGGFSYGDYLRTGAVARFAPIMDAVRLHADRGGLVMGICNGFQILCEAGMLPGALVRNVGCKFVCRHVRLRVENNDTPFTSTYRADELLQIPIAHGEGCYVCDADTERELNARKRVLFRYVDEYGMPASEGNPNGSQGNIAGIVNATFNIMGMMPHPERASEKILGSADGRGIFESMAAVAMDRLK